jgi:hypothetical protein
MVFFLRIKAVNNFTVRVYTQKGNKCSPVGSRVQYMSYGGIRCAKHISPEILQAIHLCE